VKPADYHRVAAAQMSEAQLTESVRDLCTGLRLWRWHHLCSRGTTPGWPDEVIAGPRGVLFRELKRQHGRVSPAQRHCLDLLAGAGMDVAVWRPLDLHTGRILAELRAIG
jgi:hypothetical protein